MFKRIFKLVVVLSVLMVNSFVYAQDDNIPPQFIFNQSQNQGGYLFLSADINGVQLEEDDWIGAFNGDVCVGARQWNLSACLNNLCEIVVMGVDDTDFTAGYLHNFQWENGVFEFPITYVEDENSQLRMSSRIDESTWSIPVNETFERYYENQSSTRVMTMILHSFSFLDHNETEGYYLEDQSKVEAFRSFMHNLSDEYTIVSASQLQDYIDNGTIEGEFKLPLRFLENECHR